MKTLTRPIPPEQQMKTSEYSMIRHSISLKFESFNPDSSVPIIRTRDDIIAALTASNMGPVKIIQTSVVTTYARFESELVS